MEQPSRFSVKSVCVYCGSNPGRQAAYMDTARELGAALATAGITVVYGGASVGTMGAVADAALAGGGRVIGVIPEHMAAQEVAHESLTELVVTATMHERKQVMADRADAFVALPGGLGTLEEAAEAITWAQLRLHQKPVLLLNVAGFYNPLLDFFDHAVAEQFVHPSHRDIVLDATTVNDALTALARWQPGAPPATKWIERHDDGSWR